MEIGIRTRLGFFKKIIRFGYGTLHMWTLHMDQGIILVSKLFFDPTMGRTLGHSFVIFVTCND